MARIKSDNPRVEQLLLRLTTEELRLLQSVAHLDSSTPNSYACRILTQHLAVMAEDPLVKRDLANRAAYDQRASASATVPLRAPTVPRLDLSHPEGKLVAEADGRLSRNRVASRQDPP